MERLRAWLLVGGVGLLGLAIVVPPPVRRWLVGLGILLILIAALPRVAEVLLWLSLVIGAVNCAILAYAWFTGGAEEVRAYHRDPIETALGVLLCWPFLALARRCCGPDRVTPWLTPEQDEEAARRRGRGRREVQRS
jgi:hypothetical protein